MNNDPSIYRNRSSPTTFNLATTCQIDKLNLDGKSIWWATKSTILKNQLASRKSSHFCSMQLQQNRATNLTF